MIYDPCANKKCGHYTGARCYLSRFCPDYIPDVHLFIDKEEANMNMYNTFSDQSTTAVNTNYCQYRLPCGICEKLKTPCLKQNNTTITWTTQTTNAGGTSNE